MTDGILTANVVASFQSEKWNCLFLEKPPNKSYFCMQWKYCGDGKVYYFVVFAEEN